MKLIPNRITLLLAFILATSPATAEVPRDTALGFSGVIYVARNGTCAELLGKCAAETINNPIVVVDLLRAGDEPQRLLLPTTEDSQTEGIPTLFVESASDTLYVVWESRTGPDVSRVNLAWLRDGEWSSVVEVSGDSEPLKGPPRVEITRDTFVLADENGEDHEHLRSVLHLAWSEQGEDYVEAFYTPIVLEDAVYLGANTVFNLARLDPNPAIEEATGIPSNLLLAPRLRPGRDHRAVIVGLANPASERFLSFEIRLIPGELTELAQLVMDEMLSDSNLLTPETLGVLADRIRSHIVDVGFRFHPGVTNSLANSVHSLLLGVEDGDPSEMPSLSERIRSHIVDVGSRMLDAGGLSSATPPPVDLLLSAAPPVDGVVPGLVDHIVRLQLVDDRPVPAVGPNQTSFYVSNDGTKSIISWIRKGNVHYRESRGDGWTAVRKIELGGPIDKAMAERILRQRVNDL